MGLPTTTSVCASSILVAVSKAVTINSVAVAQVTYIASEYPPLKLPTYLGPMFKLEIGYRAISSSWINNRLVEGRKHLYQTSILTTIFVLHHWYYHYRSDVTWMRSSFE